MKLFHLSDLHLGKSVHEFSLIKDQEYILQEILRVAEEEQPEAVLIAGDVFDRTVASAEALRLFDCFLVALSKQQIQVFIISGNHDSAERLSFAARLLQGSGIHICRAYEGNVEFYTLTDAYGEVDIYLLPFLKPSAVKRYFPEVQMDSWTETLAAALQGLPLQVGRRSILVAHQFVTGALRTESEEIHIGGADNVDVSVFEGFDYVALGHLHRPQSVGRQTVRYAGSPLKYSFSEAGHNKSITVTELAAPGQVKIREIPLVPKRDMREIRGRYLEVTAQRFYAELNREDYYHIILTDEEDQPDAIGKLRVIYPNLMRLDYDNRRTRSVGNFSDALDVRRLTPLELFSFLYREQNGQELSATQKKYLEQVISEVWEGRKCGQQS